MNILLLAIAVLFTVVHGGTVREKRQFESFPFGFGPAEIECDWNVTRFREHETFCDVFYECDLVGSYRLKRCPFGLVWNQYCPLEGRCDVASEDQLQTCDASKLMQQAQFGIDDTLTYLNWTGTAPRELELYNPWCNFDCGNGEVLPGWAECDGIEQCSNRADELAEICALPCDEENCQLPDCLCASTSPPGGLRPEETPQMVMIGWESGVRLHDFRWLMNLLFSRDKGRTRRQNPNGCDTVGTFFPTHIYSDYYGVEYLNYLGHEIGSLSITQRLPSQWWSRASSDQLRDEIANHRIILENLGKVPSELVKGVRAPYLEVSNNYFRMLQENGFTYDSSMPTKQVEPPVFPHTLDYLSPLSHTDECIVLGCPTVSLPGLWEFPMIDWTYLNGTICGNQIDACAQYDTVEDMYAFLRMQYERHAENRAPFPLFLRAGWFEEDLIDYGGVGLQAMSRFLDELEADDNVYFVTLSQALAWMRDPTPLSRIQSFDPWRWCDETSSAYVEREEPCKITFRTAPCAYNITMPYWKEPQEVRFYTCQECPFSYPFPNNPAGDPTEEEPILP